jgi:hypothetical protein
MTISETELKEIFALSKKVDVVPFPLIVKASSGFDIIPVDDKDPQDRALLKTLKEILDSYLVTLKKSHYRLEGDRPNEVGSRIEGGLVHEMERSSLKVIQLIKKGYPDIELYDAKGRLTYVEVKVSSSIEPKDLRAFFYSGGKKIKGNARHLLLSLSISKVLHTPNVWEVKRYAISDLSNLKVKLKTEFNATQKVMTDRSLEIFSSEL